MAVPAVYPDASSVEQGRLRVGGCDAIELAREFGTPAYVMAEEDLRRTRARFTSALAAHHDGPGEVVSPPRPARAPPSCACSPRRAWAATSPAAGSCTWRCKAGFDPRGSTCTATRSRRRSWPMAVAAGVGTIVIDNAEDVAKLGRVLGRRGRRQRVLLRVRPGVDADTHARDPHRPRGVQVRPRPARRARALAADRPRTSTSPGFHFHIGSQLVDLDALPGARSGARERSATSASTRSAAGSPWPTPTTTGRRGSRDSVAAHGRGRARRCSGRARR